MSCPVSVRYLPCPARPIPTLASFANLYIAHLADNVGVVYNQCSTRLTTHSHQNEHILLTLTDYHCHVIFNVGVQPPGGVQSLNQPNITGLALEDVATFPSFETVYPFLRFLSPHVVIVGHGREALYHLTAH